MERISELPLELQGHILSHYMKNSFPRYSYLKTVFAGNGSEHMLQLVNRSFKPLSRNIYIRDRVCDSISLSKTLGNEEWVEIEDLIREAGRSSGLIIAIENMCADALNWERGRICLRTSSFGWFRVLEFSPYADTWDFVN